MTQLNFDASTVSPDMGLDAFPAGWYNAAMDSSEMKPTKDGSGAYLECGFKILDGQYANRKVFARLNLRNANQVAVEIAYKELSAICHATGRLKVTDSTELHGIPMKIKVKVRKDPTGEYEDSNEITNYKNINDPTAGATAAPGAPAVPAAAPAAAPATPAGFAPPPAAAAPAAPVAPAAPQPWSQPPAAAGAPAAPAAPSAAPPATEGAPPWQQPPAEGAPPAGAPAAPAPGAQPPAPAGAQPPPWQQS